MEITRGLVSTEACVVKFAEQNLSPYCGGDEIQYLSASLISLTLALPTIFRFFCGHLWILVLTRTPIPRKRRRVRSDALCATCRSGCWICVKSLDVKEAVRQLPVDASRPSWVSMVLSLDGDT